MLSAFADRIDLNHPRTEYPRPQLVRDNWMDLNGVWEFAGALRDSIPQRFSSTIVVPFPPESELSGVGKPYPKGYCLWYRRAFTLPESFADGRVLLHFGAVDQIASVWCNGVSLGEHVGGYTPFRFDITDCLQEGENVLLVRAEDPGTKGIAAFGSQARSVSFSGIWQPVWLECVPEESIDALILTPHIEDGTVDVTVSAAGGESGLDCTVTLCGTAYALTTGLPYTLPVTDYTLWTPENPALIPVSAALGADTVESYFAMRSFTLGRDGNGVPCFLLNNEPYFVRGVQESALWPDGLAAAPSDEAFAFDISAAKSYGFNALHLHDKVECARFYYYCDTLGILVFQDIPTGGSDRGPLLPVRDSAYTFFGRRDTESRSQYLRELREIAGLLQNSPCVVLWTLFSSDRGRFDAENCRRYLAELDPTRPIDLSGGCNVKGSLLRSVRFFGRKLRFAPDKSGRVSFLSACGGKGYVTDGHVAPGKPVSAERLDSPQGLLFAIEELMEDIIVPARQDGLAGFFYSQLTDVGTDVTGLLPADRRVEKLSPRQLKKIIRL